MPAEDQEPVAAADLTLVDEDGAWQLAQLAGRDDAVGHLSREFAAAIDELAVAVSDFSAGAARSSVSIRVVSDKVERLSAQINEVAGGSTRSGSPRICVTRVPCSRP